MTDRTPHIRTSERVMFKRCQRAWWWAYREGLRPRGERTPLWFGTIMHVSLANWYCGPGFKRGPHPAETFASLADDALRAVKVKDATDEERAVYVDAKALGISMMENYIARYGRDEQCLMIAPEQKFSFDIPFPDWFGEPTRKLLAHYDGTFDGVYRDAVTGLIWLWEHKSARSIQTGHLPLDEQGGSYWAVATRSLRKQNLIGEKDKLSGIMYNFLRKAYPDGRPVDSKGYACNKPEKKHYLEALTPGADQLPGQLSKLTLSQLEVEAIARGITVLGDRSKSQPAPLFHREPVKRTRAEQRSQLLRIQTDAGQMELIRTGEVPATKTPHTSCSKLCDFYDMCRLEETGGKWKDLRAAAFVRADPYAEHRKSSEEVASFEP